MGEIRTTGTGGTQVGGITVNTPFEDKSKTGVKVEDFLQLMIAQMSNQDFMNPTDDTQYVTQLAQFAQMESMQELSHYSQTNYVQSLVGKTVTAASYGIGGSVNKETGTVSKVNISADGFTIVVNGKEFKLSQIMSLDDSAGKTKASDLAAAQNMPLIETSKTSDSLAFRWLSPVNDADKQKELTYDVYYFDPEKDPSVNFDDVDAIKKNGTKAASGLKDLSYVLEGLEKGSTYYVNVVVSNKTGDSAAYQHFTMKT